MENENVVFDNAEEVAFKFYDWLIDNEYCSEEDKVEDIADFIKDFIIMQREVPMMFNLLRDICDK